MATPQSCGRLSRFCSGLIAYRSEVSGRYVATSRCPPNDARSTATSISAAVRSGTDRSPIRVPPMRLRWSRQVPPTRRVLCHRMPHSGAGTIRLLIVLYRNKPHCTANRVVRLSPYSTTTDRSNADGCGGVRNDDSSLYRVPRSDPTGYWMESVSGGPSRRAGSLLRDCGARHREWGGLACRTVTSEPLYIGLFTGRDPLANRVQRGV